MTQSCKTVAGHGTTCANTIAVHMLHKLEQQLFHVGVCMTSNNRKCFKSQSVAIYTRGELWPLHATKITQTKLVTLAIGTVTLKAYA